MHLIYEASRPLARVLIHLLCCYRVVRHDNPSCPGIPEGPLVVVANHLHALDPLLVGFCMRRRIAFMAKEELFGSFFARSMLHAYGAFPISRGNSDREAMRMVRERMRQGWALGMFPEGTRSISGGLQRAYPGVALIALRNDAYILPVAVEGSEKIRGGVHLFTNLHRRPKVTIHIGEPFKLPYAGGRSNHRQLSELTDYIMRQLALLLPDSYCGVYREDSK